MKIVDVILLPLAAALVIVGAHMTFTQGITASYPIFMLAVGLLLWFKLRKVREEEDKKAELPKSMKGEKKKKRK